MGVLPYLHSQVFLLQPPSVAELLDGLGETAVLQVLHSGLHCGQEALELGSPLRVLTSSIHVLPDLLSADQDSTGRKDA